MSTARGRKETSSWSKKKGVRKKKYWKLNWKNTDNYINVKINTVNYIDVKINTDNYIDVKKNTDNYIDVKTWIADVKGEGTASLSALHSSWAPSCFRPTEIASSLRPVPVLEDIYS